MPKCFDCESKDAQKFYIRTVPCGEGCECGFPRNLCSQHRQQLAAELASDATCTFSIVPIEQHEAEREAEKIFADVMREIEHETRERGERELLRLLDL